MIQFDFTGVDAFIDKSQWSGYEKRAHAAHEALLNGTGQGSDWLGWRTILKEPNDALLENITALGQEIAERADVLLCVGIGGSYLGAEAIIEALSPYFPQKQTDDTPTPARVLFAGHHISGAYLEELLGHLEGKSVYVNVISKSGTTLEPAVAFRIIRSWMEEQFDDCHQRIIATTDEEKGALRTLAKQKGYRTYVIPQDVGGRFSVLTPVGLLPIAAAGYDIQSLFYGAVSMMGTLEKADDNPAIDYALRRYLLHEAGFTTEIMSVFEPRLKAVGAWWQQLFGESEGKNHKGLFPVVSSFSTDLHSLGQYIQDGKRNIIETFLTLEKERGDLRVPPEAANLDQLNYLTGVSFPDINRAAFEGTSRAHLKGGVPIFTISLSSTTEENLGRLIYFFEHAVAVGGYLLGINPFDQPGVEAYKQEMFRLLGRP
ncbi:MAG: glucose-6-phosphate isomerase [Bacteroidetes Order II. Incertae sedis bacterium]|nr:glucose-6-phosphate isomerase [Bacteroidetes Order II. bacterium]MBT6582598.1 glucose-6-phosphate isomerase [Bacteroidetes Order II. bacterium]